MDGTGTSGAGLARFLSAAQIQVLEVNRPNRARRRRRGTSYPTDAEQAARAVLAGEAAGRPKAQTGLVEALRVLTVTRRRAVKARTQAANQLRALIVTAPEPWRAELRARSLARCARRCARLRPISYASPLQATKRALRALAGRWQALTAELVELDAHVAALTEVAAPRRRSRVGIGPLTAATMLVTAGDNPDRLRSEAALAALCGASPVEASSGQVVRHRLNRGGDRQANHARWTITLTRMRSDARTLAYVERRTREGRSPKEIRRCLKRYIVRELYPLLLEDLRDAPRFLLT